MRNFRSSLQALGWPVALGLALAVIVLQFKSEQATVTVSSQPRGPASYATAVEIATPAVVNIFTTKVVERRYDQYFDHPLLRQFFSRKGLLQRERMERSLGSGVIMSETGYILTNYHVVEGADEIQVQLYDGRSSLARVAGTDPPTDLAVLEIDLENLRPIPLGDPSKARVGDVVLAIGNPYGFGHSVTQGIISATGRYGLQLNDNDYENYIQTDAAINPGNSGGALVSANGRLLGINSALYSRSGGSLGIGLAIPADYAVRVMDDLIEYGDVRRGWLGLEVQPMPLRLQEPNSDQSVTGLVVAGVYSNGPADRGGVLPGDVILSIGDVPIDQGRSPMYRIAMTAPGTIVAAEVYRNGEIINLQLEVGQKPAS